jgi:Protein of unknown function (DUF1501)
MRDLPPQVTRSRREFLRRAGGGFGALALADLLRMDGGLLEQEPGKKPDSIKPFGAGGGIARNGLHHAPKAKSVIYLFLYGGPSGMDTFDPKPTLDRLDGKTPPANIDTFFKDNGNLMKSPYSFKQYGESGRWVCNMLPHMAEHVDDMAFLQAVQCASNNHAPALLHLNTGLPRVGFPSVGSWLSYGLGNVTQELPGFIVMYDWRGGPIAGPQNWGTGFLPSRFQATPFRAGGTPILNLARPDDVSARTQRAQLDLLAEINKHHLDHNPGQSDLEARIESYELASRMQLSAPEAIDLDQESDATKELYGLNDKRSEYFGKQCLAARRLVERGVRTIQLYSGGGHQQESWDAHFGLKDNMDEHCPEIDKPIAGLLTDLKQRGLLDETLVVWGGEFGRMPMSQGSNGGRDHNPDGFLMWMAGGGVKGGASYGETDDIGWQATEGKTAVNDVHATILHLMGIDHEKLTYRFNGRDFRLTDVAGRVVSEILA